MKIKTMKFLKGTLMEEAMFLNQLAKKFYLKIY